MHLRALLDDLARRAGPGGVRGHHHLEPHKALARHKKGPSQSRGQSDGEVPAFHPDPLPGGRPPGIRDGNDGPRAGYIGGGRLSLCGLFTVIPAGDFFKPLSLLGYCIPLAGHCCGKVRISLILGLDHDLKRRNDGAQPDRGRLDIGSQFPFTGHGRSRGARWRYCRTRLPVSASTTMVLTWNASLKSPPGFRW